LRPQCLLSLGALVVQRLESSQPNPRVVVSFVDWRWSAAQSQQTALTISNGRDVRPYPKPSQDESTDFSSFYNYSVLCIPFESEYRFLLIKSMNKYAVQKNGFMQNSAQMRRLAANLKIKFCDV
jgi:hypothetical protein